MLSSAKAAARLLRSPQGRAAVAALQTGRGRVSSRFLAKELKAGADVRASTCCCVSLQTRSFAASAADGDVAPTLGEVVQEELDYERSVEGTNEPIPAPPPGWSLSQEDGSSLVRVARSHEGEQIVVTIDINPTDDDSLPSPVANFDEAEEGAAVEEQPLEEDIDSSAVLDFEIEISKKGDKLRIEALFDGEVIDIQHVGHGLNDEGRFGGPDYNSLDPTLQQAFVDYLAERGIDAEFGEYLMAAHDAKEQKEYVHWLSRLNSFLA